MKHLLSTLISLIVLSSCINPSETGKEVIAVPVYGQSLALGEEAVRITNFDSLACSFPGRIVTENLDAKFGYLADTHFKQWVKKVIRYDKRSFELSIYGMAEFFISHTSNDNLIICIFPGGKGASKIADIAKGTPPYKKFMNEIEKACKKAKRRGWSFSVPAVCWMQGETDITDGTTSESYKKILSSIREDMDKDIRKITGQDNEVFFICYQSNCLTLSKDFKSNEYKCREVGIPQSQLELIKENQWFAASGPTYPYNVVNERVHIDGAGQKRIGSLAGCTLLDIMDNVKTKGLIPDKITYLDNNTAVIKLTTDYPPIVIDTISVTKAINYGFSVINENNIDVLNHVILQGNDVYLHCSEKVQGCYLRYAVNGEPNKTGNTLGPRGNIRDSKGDIFSVTILGARYPLHNYLFQFSLQ